METQGIEQMFDFQRLPNDGLVLLLVLLYSPVGLCLMLLRIFVGAHVFLVSCALPDSLARRFIVRVMSSVLGMHVRQNSPRLRDKSTKLYICNHVTQFDHNIVNLLTSCNTPMLEDSAGFVCWARGFMELGAISGQDEMESLRRYCSSPGTLPLLLFPEEDTTNGRAGLLKFSSWPFSLTDSIQPVALQVKRPFLALSTPDSFWLTELLWTFFVPCTVYHVRWLPAVSRQDEESLQEFANKIQGLLATELGVVSTQITKADKAEHVKRKLHVAPHTTTSNLGARPRPLGFMVRSSGVEELRISRMAQQVKEVLPDIPLGIITRDLVQTNCVDTTITNLLESTEEFPLEATGGSTSAPGPSWRSLSFSDAPAPTIKPAAKSFGKSPVDRHMSLQERKDALYEFARRRYIEKHGLEQDDNL
ncbi:lipid droplet-regulating VLDL assembly factor AUP1-like isoform X1 [Oncorhynchus keta]|uniref:lipid droplet-regulating VLDL assembly factor AUP1-like isoform X1 n=2 Tax=Oncorhynchus keta TaxID=8018 RepID=UPI0015FD5EAF|nr:lipid droplet-regulating VLDL assembly factor AUP1-like isoform X1 [Oncorhynchus keta]XP_035600132.1 lipid droplet-regulating VLDL assembly factor AUP1-like isoform X1 [Oncorhynchus keta]